jgi:hypothetical protein
VADKNLIDPREYERVLRSIEQYDLGAHDPRIAVLLRQINAGNPSGLDLRLWQELRTMVARFEAFHREVPFRTASRDVPATEGVVVLRQFANGAPISLHPAELARNFLVLGSSGSGKTSLLLTLADTILTKGYDVWYFDVKRDAPRLAIRHGNVLALHANALVDLFARPAYLSIPEHITTIIEALARAMFGGQGLRAIAHEVFTYLFATIAHPTVHDAIRYLTTLPKRGDVYERLNAIRNLTVRLERLVERYPGLGSSNGMPAYELAEHPVLFSYLSMTDVEEFLTSYFITHLFHHHRCAGVRELRTLIVMDESLLLFRSEGGTSRISGNAAAELVALTREFGTGWAISSTAAHLLDPLILANAFGVIALNASSGTDAEFISRLCGLTKEELSYYRVRLTRGQAVVRLADRHRHPMLATLDAWPHEKTVTAQEWDGICDRINARRPTETPQEQDPIPFNTPAPRRIVLTTHAHAILEDVAAHPYTLTTPAYDRCGLHFQQGDRAKMLLLKLGLIASDKVRTGKGRGKTGSCMHLTAAGWTWLQRTPAKRTRGGGPQHEFLAHHLARTLGGSLETLGADVIIRVDSAQHETFAVALNAKLADGSLVAIQVEVSDPAKTIPPNAARDATTGFDLTVFAVMPEALDTAKNIIAESERIIIVDALHLVEAVR